MEKSQLCERTLSLFTTLNFSARGPTNTTVFNVSSPSSRRHNNNNNNK